MQTADRLTTISRLVLACALLATVTGCTAWYEDIWTTTDEQVSIYVDDPEFARMSFDVPNPQGEGRRRQSEWLGRVTETGAGVLFAFECTQSWSLESGELSSCDGLRLDLDCVQDSDDVMICGTGDAKLRFVRLP